MSKRGFKERFSQIINWKHIFIDILRCFTPWITHGGSLRVLQQNHFTIWLEHFGESAVCDFDFRPVVPDHCFYWYRWFHWWHLYFSKLYHLSSFLCSSKDQRCYCLSVSRAWHLISGRLSLLQLVMKPVCVEWERGVIAGRHGKKYFYPLSALTLTVPGTCILLKGFKAD